MDITSITIKQGIYLVATLFCSIFVPFAEGSTASYGPCSKEGLVGDIDDPRIYYNCTSIYLKAGEIVSLGSANSSQFFEYSILNCPDGYYWSPTKEKCRKDSNQPNYKCLKKSLDNDSIRQCYKETLEALHSGLQDFIDAAATRGDSRRNFHLSVKDIHLNMRQNYAKMIATVGENIYPLIVATENESPALAGTGGVYKVYFRNGTMRRIVPVGPDFELHKCLSHMVLGIFSIVSPYFRTSASSINWKPQLQNFDNLVNAALYALPWSGLPAKDQLHIQTMLHMVHEYIGQALDTSSVNYKKFHEFATALAPWIDKSMQVAAKAHVTSTLPALQQLKAEMGDELWRKTYVLIPTVWPVSLYNIRLQMFRKVMDFEQIKQQVLIVEGARTEEDARTTLGRIVADRALALLVFGGREEDSMKDHVFSLSTRRDLLSSAEEDAAGRWCNGEDDWTILNKNTMSASEASAGAAADGDPRCPMSKAFATMLRQAP